MKRAAGSIKLLTMLSLLSAIGIILGKYLALNITPYIRFSIENLSILFAGMAFGPIYGMIVGIVQDVVGCICVGYAINPIVTLGCAVIGLSSGLFFKVLKEKPMTLRIIISVTVSHIIGSVLIKSLGLSIFYNMPFVTTLAWRSLNYVIIDVIEILMLKIMVNSKQLLSKIAEIAPNTPLLYNDQKDKNDEL